jgi:hypothetical protein
MGTADEQPDLLIDTIFAERFVRRLRHGLRHRFGCRSDAPLGSRVRTDGFLTDIDASSNKLPRPLATLGAIRITC